MAAPPGVAQPVPNVVPHQQHGVHGVQPQHVHPEVAKVVAVPALSYTVSKVLVSY